MYLLRNNACAMLNWRQALKTLKIIHKYTEDIISRRLQGSKFLPELLREHFRPTPETKLPMCYSYPTKAPLSPHQSDLFKNILSLIQVTLRHKCQHSLKELFTRLLLLLLLLLLLFLLSTLQPWVGLGLFNNSTPLLSILRSHPPNSNPHPL
jgi:hypothetical protein